MRFLSVSCPLPLNLLAFSWLILDYLFSHPCITNIEEVASKFAEIEMNWAKYYLARNQGSWLT